MRILLDTQVWLWMVLDPSRLRSQAREQLTDPATTLWLSAASAWEIAIKNSLGKLDLPDSPDSFVPSRMRRDSVDALPVLHAHAVRVAALPLLHRDPFDRLLIAQAQHEQIPIMTADEQIRRYDIDLIVAS